MTPMEIALLIVGVIIFVLSFMLPAGSEKKTEKQIEEEQEEIRKLMEQELSGMKLRVNEATDESLDYAVDKAERLLERISNEKIMAVNEYSQTILEEINKNHQEVMFLYDMLKDKQTDITNSVRRADAVAKEMETLSESAISASEGLRREMTAMGVSAKGLTDEQKSVFDMLDAGTEAKPTGQDRILEHAKKVAENQQITNVSEIESATEAEFNPLPISAISEAAAVTDLMSNTVYHAGMPEISTPVNDEIIADTLASVASEKPASSSAATNNNQRILELHEQGMSTVDIAKELKLGVGEVKLVIDLYR